MIRVLCVDDNGERVRQLSQVIGQIDGVDVGAITAVTNVHSARKELARTAFDLLVLDIALPPRVDQEVDPKAGLALLEEIDRRADLLTPGTVIGITAYEDIYEEAVSRFTSRMSFIIHYDIATEDWKEQVRAVARQTIAAQQDRQRGEQSYESEVAILCALPTPELRAVLRNGWEWEQYHRAHDDTIYYRAAYGRHGNARVAYAASSLQAGMLPAAVLAANMISAFKPAVIAMVGIAAGTRGEVSVGDIIVADPSWDWGSGKLVQIDGEEVLLPAPRQLSLAPGLRSRLELMSRDSLALETIAAGWQGATPTNRLQMRLGPLACGAAVVSSDSARGRIGNQQRKFLGVEMEGYGVFSAAEGASRPRPSALVMKSVVDFGDAQKSDAFQAYGSYTSAMALKAFLEKFID